MYRKVIPRVRPGDPIKAKDINDIVAAVEQALKISVDGSMAMFQSSAGTQLRANIPPQPYLFKLTQDTPQDQGYVTARRRFWRQDVSQWATDDGGPEDKIYDPEDFSSNWTKKDFTGQAIWNPARGVWLIDRIQHVAKFINFTLTADLASGDTTATGSFTDFWDGVTPAGGNSGNINLLTGPTSDYKASSGASGTAVWRSDLDNSSAWQYQITDIAETC